ncbi:Hypothetical predicted protein [Pelobates cultripes]|uniref:Uncharacterized protein n=1 Tax=Pelobates cultripes TaxID=61616 RepID=A0AAD1VY09_PELCU|nr:Hypothetical predicted protein [Pelobates cultripes]
MQPAFHSSVGAPLPGFVISGHVRIRRGWNAPYATEFFAQLGGGTAVSGYPISQSAEAEDRPTKRKEVTERTGKVKQRLKAYRSPTISRLEYFLDGVYSRGEPEPTSAPLTTHNTTPTNMGRRTQKTQSGHPVEQADIGALLQRQARSKMAAEAQQTPTTSRTVSHTPVQTKADSEYTLTPPQAPPDNTLATKQDLHNWVQDIKTLTHLTSQLRATGVPYRWGAPRSLLITHKGTTYRV